MVGGGHMQKEIIANTTTPKKTHGDPHWLDLESIARVQLTSEAPSFPIENALSTNPERNEIGWRAATPGPQTIALIFTVSTHLRRIFLRFIEHKTERTQEFVLRYSSEKETNREIVRQQWNFSPTGSSQEIEDYTVDLHGVTTLELIIDPDRGRGDSHATLNALRLA
jgi:hypothetical protein